jgi:aspartate aminotransferase-like enzyme
MTQHFDDSIPELTMASGPTTIYPQVLAAMSKPMMHHHDPHFTALMHGVTAKLAQVFKTAGTVLPIAGESIVGLEMAAYNLVQPGDVCINIVTGVYGAGYSRVLKAYGAQVVEVRTAYNSSVTMDMVLDAMNSNPQAKIIAMVHSETPSASENPIKEICMEAHRRGMLSIVDSVSGIGGSNVETDAWDIDICVTGSQKCLSCSAGMALVSVSDKAWDAIMACPRYDSSYLSFKPWRRKWLEHSVLPYTAPISLVYGLDAALDIILDAGVDETITRHETAAKGMRAAVLASGLELWIDDEAHAAHSVTAIRIPQGVEDTELRATLRESYGLCVSGGLGPMDGQLVRIGHMGATATRQRTITAFSALACALADLGHPIDATAGLDTLRRVWSER